MFITGDAYELWNRTEVWGKTINVFKPIWDESPDFVISLGTIHKPHRPKIRRGWGFMNVLDMHYMQ